MIFSFFWSCQVSLRRTFVDSSVSRIFRSRLRAPLISAPFFERSFFHVEIDSGAIVIFFLRPSRRADERMTPFRRQDVTGTRCRYNYTGENRNPDW